MPREAKCTDTGGRGDVVLRTEIQGHFLSTESTCCPEVPSILPTRHHKKLRVAELYFLKSRNEVEEIGPSSSNKG